MMTRWGWLLLAAVLLVGVLGYEYHEKTVAMYEHRLDVADAARDQVIWVATCAFSHDQEGSAKNFCNNARQMEPLEFQAWLLQEATGS